MKKWHPLLTVGLLIALAPAPSSLPLAPAPVHAAAQQDTIKERTRPAADTYDISDARSIKAPVPWLIVEDHRKEAYDADGKLTVSSSYPTIRLCGKEHPALSRTLDAWNKKQASDASKAFRSAYQQNQEDRAYKSYPLPSYSDDTLIMNWGRVDDRIVSFCLYDTAYLGGTHPMHIRRGMTFDAQTGKRIDLAQMISDRETLLQALAAAFRAQYPPKRENELFANNIEEQLETCHPPEKGFDTFSWYMDAHGDLIFLYAPYALAPYASGDFMLTVKRADIP